MSKPFHFKHFSIAQEHCAMKVGTDGVLLGAWAKAPQNPQRILDVGTGSGVIALQLAQRFSNADIMAVDIDKGAVQQAHENFQNSKFSERLFVQNVDFNVFDSTDRFDCIVSNPPFFTEGVLPLTAQRKLARHAVSFSFELFFGKVVQLLSKKGICSVVLPKEGCEEKVKIAEGYGLFCTEVCTVFPNYNKEPKRVLLEFKKEKQKIHYTELTIETENRHEYTVEYRTLLKDFYLAF